MLDTLSPVDLTIINELTGYGVSLVDATTILSRLELPAVLEADDDYTLFVWRGEGGSWKSRTSRDDTDEDGPSPYSAIFLDLGEMIRDAADIANAS